MALTLCHSEIARRLDDAATALAGLVRLGEALALNHDETLAYEIVCIVRPIATALADVSRDLQDWYVLSGAYQCDTKEDC